MKQILITIAAVVLVGCGGPKDIWEAATDGNIEAVKQHLADGTDVNAKNERRWTPLHIAAVEGHKEITELLIAKGARLISFEAHELGSIWGDEPKRSISPAQE